MLLAWGFLNFTELRGRERKSLSSEASERNGDMMGPKLGLECWRTVDTWLILIES